MFETISTQRVAKRFPRLQDNMVNPRFSDTGAPEAAEFPSAVGRLELKWKNHFSWKDSMVKLV